MLPGVTLVLVGGPILTPSSNPALCGVNLEVVGGTTLNINNLILINFHISLITKRFSRSFDRHSDKTVTLRELLQDINNFSKTIVDIRKSHEFSFKIVRVITIVVSNPVNFLVNACLWRQSTASWYSMTSWFSAILLLSPSYCILYTLLGVSIPYVIAAYLFFLLKI